MMAVKQKSDIYQVILMNVETSGEKEKARNGLISEMKYNKFW